LCVDPRLRTKNKTYLAYLAFFALLFGCAS
jgi:hypothetical protein